MNNRWHVISEAVLDQVEAEMREHPVDWDRVCMLIETAATAFEKATDLAAYAR